MEGRDGIETRWRCRWGGGGRDGDGDRDAWGGRGVDEKRDGIETRWRCRWRSRWAGERYRWKRWGGAGAVPARFRGFRIELTSPLDRRTQPVKREFSLEGRGPFRSVVERTFPARMAMASPADRLRQCLRGRDGCTPMGREGEADRIRDVLVQAKSAVGFVAGPPGSGKTHTVRSVMAKCVEDEDKKEGTDGREGKEKVTTCWINCMSLNQPGDLYRNLLGAMEPTTAAKSGHDAKEAWKSMLRSIRNRNRTGRRKISVVLVLDECDAFVAARTDWLAELQEFCLLVASRCTLKLICISNSPELAGKLMPLLQKSMSHTEIIIFQAYKTQEIKNVLADLLEEGGLLDWFSPSALQFCAKKIGSQSGDMRYAFCVCMTALELSLGSRATDAPSTKEADMVQEKRQAVEMEHMHAAFQANGHGGMSKPSNAITALPLHQRLILFTLSKGVLASKDKDVTVAQLTTLHYHYERNCRKRLVKPLSFQQVATACKDLADAGLVQIHHSKNKKVGDTAYKLCRVADVRAALERSHLTTT